MEKPDTFQKVGVDSDIVAYRASYATQEKSVDDTYDVVDELMNFIVDQTVAFRTEDNLSVYLTGPGNFRYDIAKTYTYKGNRKDREKPKHLNAARDYLVDYWGAAVVEGIEADDQLAMEATSFHDPYQYVIASVDKDMKTIPTWHFNFVKNEFVCVSELEALNFFYEQILTGDTADNIKGLHRVGPKKAQKALEGCTTQQEMFEATLKMYEERCTDGDPLERLIENARLLYLQRYEGELWEVPK